MEANKDN